MRSLELDKPISGKVLTLSGNVGSGKNSGSLAIARWMAKRCIHNLRLTEQCPYCDKYGITQKERELTIYSNFHINFPHIRCRYMTSPLDFISIPSIKKDRGHRLAIIDEPNAWGFDSRESIDRKGFNVVFARKVQQTRHYNMDIIFLTQLWSMYDLRGRRLSGAIMAVDPTARDFRYGIVKTEEIIPFTVRKIWARKAIFPFYDSSEIISLFPDDQDATEDQKIETRENDSDEIEA